jgi:hypothetical protein
VFDTTMTTLKERLTERQAATADGSHAAAEPVPSPVVEPGRHAATPHNTRRALEVLRVHYGKESQVSLPYAYLAMADMPDPETLVLDFASCTVTVKGYRLEELLGELDNRRVALIRASGAPEFDTGIGPFIESVSVSKAK